MWRVHRRVEMALWSVAIGVPKLDERRLFPLPRAALAAFIRHPAARTTLIIFGITALPLLAAATTISMPNLFSNGTVALAQDVNENFNVLVLESNAQDARITVLESGGGSILDLSELPQDSATDGQVITWSNLISEWEAQDPPVVTFIPNTDPGVDHSSYIPGHFNGTDCAAGNAPLGVNGAGSATGCFDVQTAAEQAVHVADAAVHHPPPTAAGAPLYLQFQCASGGGFCGVVDLRWDDVTKTLRAGSFLSDDIDTENGMLLYDNPSGYNCSVTLEDVAIVADSSKGGTGNGKTFVCRPDGNLYELAAMESDGSLKVAGLKSTLDPVGFSQGPYSPLRYGFEEGDGKAWSNAYHVRDDSKDAPMAQIRAGAIRGMMGPGSDQTTMPISARNDINIAAIEGSFRVSLVQQEVLWNGNFAWDDRLEIFNTEGIHLYAGTNTGASADLHVWDKSKTDKVVIKAPPEGETTRDVQWPLNEGRIVTQMCDTTTIEGALDSTASDRGWLKFPNTAILDSISCILEGTSPAVTLDVERCNQDLASCTAFDAAYSCVATDVTGPALISSTPVSMQASDRLRLDFSSPTGTQAYTHITVCYHEAVVP